MAPRVLKNKRKLSIKVGSSASINEKMAKARKRFIRSERRLIRAHSRIKSLEEERDELLERNTKSLESFQAQKLETAARVKDSMNVQKLYHDARVTINSYEVKLKELYQGVNASLKEIDLMFPNLVSLSKISESLATNKLRLKNMRSLLASSGQDNLPRIAPEELSPASKRNLKPIKHMVGPMVRGMLITKPRIVLERFMLPQQQDQEQGNHEEDEVGINRLTPIQEDHNREVEEMGLRNVSDRGSKRRLGRGPHWRMNHKNGVVSGSLDRKTKEKERLAPAMNFSSSSDSGESDSDHPSLPRGLMEPVVRIRDVSRLLQNSSLIKVETEPNGNGVGSENNIPSRRVAGTLPPSNHEDPLEGSSWMFQNRRSYRPVKRDKPESSSESSDEENLADVMHHQKPLYRPNSTFKVPRKSSLSPLKRKSSERPAENSFHEAEPDSTNNFEIDISDAQEDPNSSSSSVNSLSRSYPDSKRQTLNISQFNRNIVPTCASTPSNPIVNETLSNTLHSGGSSIQALDLESSNINTREKRVRKPKTMLYPGEKDYEPDNGREPKKRNKKHLRLSSPSNPVVNETPSNTLHSRGSSIPIPDLESSNINTREKRVRKPKTMLYPGEKDNEPDQGREPKKRNKQKRNRLSSGGKSTLKNKIRKSNSSLAKKSVSKEDKKETNISKKSSKLSLITPRNSSISDTLSDFPEASRSSSRRKKNVSYKEPSLSKKMRKPSLIGKP